MAHAASSWGAIALTLALALPAAAAATAPEVREDPAGPYITRLPAGKTLATHRAPKGYGALLLRDEGEQGDFVWRSIYAQAKGRYRLLDTCQSIKDVTWRADGQQVTFTMDAATDANRSTLSRVRHGLNSGFIHRRVLSTRAVQSSM